MSYLSAVLIGMGVGIICNAVCSVFGISSLIAAVVSVGFTLTILGVVIASKEKV